MVEGGILKEFLTVLARFSACLGFFGSYFLTFCGQMIFLLLLGWFLEGFRNKKLNLMFASVLWFLTLLVTDLMNYAFLLEF